MCVWTKKRGSMKAVVLIATSCPKALHGKGEKWIAQHFAGPGPATADDCMADVYSCKKNRPLP